MRRSAWLDSGLLILVIAVAGGLLMATAARWWLTTPQEHAPLITAQSGPLPPALADELKRREHASYLRGINDAVAFWRLTGVVPDTPALHDALWARQQRSPQPLTAEEAHMLLHQATAPR